MSLRALRIADRAQQFTSGPTLKGAPRVPGSETGRSLFSRPCLAMARTRSARRGSTAAAPYRLAATVSPGWIRRFGVLVAAKEELSVPVPRRSRRPFNHGVVRSAGTAGILES
eukprot:scaffold3775_cov182-Pinguiococcus_pyrenoidosus.AAC.4